MESFGHFIFELVKIAILGFIYSNIVYYFLKFVSKQKDNYWIQKIIESKRKLWLYVSIILFVYMITPFGYHGLGDSARLTLGINNEINNINWNEYGIVNGVETIDKNPVETTNFILCNEKLCGNLSSGFYDYKNSYFIYNLSSKKIKEFKTEIDYKLYAKKENLPYPNEFMSFEENYKNYWGGWRFWLLP